MNKLSHQTLLIHLPMLRFINGRDLIKGHNSQKIIISKLSAHNNSLQFKWTKIPRKKIRNWDFLVVCTFPSCMYIVHLHIVSHMCISYFFFKFYSEFYSILARVLLKVPKFTDKLWNRKFQVMCTSTHCALNTYKVSQNYVLHLKKSCADK